MARRTRKPSEKPSKGRNTTVEKRKTQAASVRVAARRRPGAGEGAASTAPQRARRAAAAAVADPGSVRRRSERVPPPAPPAAAPTPPAQGGRGNGHARDDVHGSAPSPALPRTPLAPSPVWFEAGFLDGMAGPQAATRMLQQAGRFNLEMALLCGRRGRTMWQAMFQFAACQTPADLWRLQLAIVIDAVGDWQRVMARTSEAGRPPEDPPAR